MYRPRTPIAVLLAALLVGTAGCDQATAPRTLDGTFVLRTVGANPLPAVTGSALGTEFLVLADTVTLRRDGTGEWISTTARREVGAEISDTARTVRQFEYRRRGQAVATSGMSCEPDCDVLPSVVEFRYEDGWLSLGSGPALQRYERLDSAPAL